MNNNIDQMILDFVKNTIIVYKGFYEDAVFNSHNNLADKNMYIYVELRATKEGKTKFEELINHENKYVAKSAAAFILNSEDNKKALKVLKEIAKEKSQFGEDTKDYIERLFNHENSPSIWEESLSKARTKALNGQLIEEKPTSESDQPEPEKMVEYTIPVFPSDKSEKINDFFKREYPDGNIYHLVDKENENKNIKIEANIIDDKNEVNYIVYTTGMSSFVMNVPKTLFGKYNNQKFSELVAFVPKDWGTHFDDAKWQALIDLMKELAVYPHLSNTWIGDKHTLEIDMTKINASFTSVLLSSIKIKNQILKVDNQPIVLSAIIPIYKEELDFVFKSGSDKLIEKLSTNQENPYLLKLDRKNVIL